MRVFFVAFYCIVFLLGFTLNTSASVNLSKLDFESIEFNSSIVGLEIRSIELDSKKNIDTQIVLQIDERLESLNGNRISMPELHKLSVWLFELLGDVQIQILTNIKNNKVDVTIFISERRKISSIRISGNDRIKVKEIESKINIKPGIEVDPIILEDEASRINQFYKDNGYIQVDVDFIVRDDNIVEFKIQEGPIAVIDKINFSDMTTVNDIVLRRKLRKSLLNAFGLAPGDVFTEAKIKEGINNVKTWLTDHDFLSASEPIVTPILVSSGEKVLLDVKIKYGPRIHFGFRNNKRFSYQELKSFILDIREVGIGPDYILTVKENILEKYNEAGLVNTKIQTEVKEDPNRGYNYISLIIEESEKVRIERIDFEGLFALSYEETADLFYSFSPRLVQRDYYQEKGVSKAAELLAEHWRSMGYLTAKFDLLKYDYDEKRNTANVTLYFTEGIQTFVDQINFQGIKNIDEKKVKEILKVDTKEPFNVFNFEKGLSLLIEEYQNLGYLKARVANENNSDIVVYGLDQSSVNINLSVEEGPLIKVGNIIVRGNTRTHARVITRELPFVKGDILTAPLFREAQENLRRLNLFSSIILRPIERPGAPEIQDLLILVEEGEPGFVEFGPGLRNDLGLRMFAGVSYQNLGGWHRGVSSNIVVNRRIGDRDLSDNADNTDKFNFTEFNFNLGFREPYFANWPVTLFTNFVSIRRIFRSFNAQIRRVSTEAKRRLTKNFTGSLQYSFERIKIENAKSAADNALNIIGAITPGINYDSRDNRFNPRKGIYSVNRFEYASPFWGSKDNISYHRSISNNSFYFPVGEQSVLALGLNLGFERSNLANEKIPIIKLFRLGGARSIRGYKEEAIEVDSQLDIFGALILMNYKTEIRTPVSGNLGAAFFMDAGNLFVDRVEKLRLRYSVGMGLRYKTPVGPVSLDYAYKLGRLESLGSSDKVNVTDLDRYRFHFSIGVF